MLEGMLDDKEKRAFIALACKVAWADGVIEASERAQVIALLQRLGGTPVTSEELDEWLTSGAPAAELADLSPAVGEMFIYEAWKLVQADGRITDYEIEFVEGLISRVDKLHKGTAVAQVALARKPPR